MCGVFLFCKFCSSSVVFQCSVVVDVGGLWAYGTPCYPACVCGSKHRARQMVHLQVYCIHYLVQCPKASPWQLQSVLKLLVHNLSLLKFIGHKFVQFVNKHSMLAS